MSALFSSRKFLIVLFDAIFGLASLAVAFFLVDTVELQIFVAAIFATLQPVFVAAINGITQEDTAALAAGIHPNQEGQVQFMYPQADNQE